MGGNHTKEYIAKDVANYEAEYLRKAQLCPQTIVEDMIGEDKEILLDRINEYRVNEDLDQRFYDYHLMNIITCLYTNLLITRSSDKNKYFDAVPETKDYFHVEKTLNSGIEGAVFLARKGGSDLKFIIKTQFNPSTAEISIHEAFIGISTLNHLRSHCPNFAFVYGGFMCGSPNTTTYSICDGKLQVPYIIYEHITGISLFDFIDIYINNPKITLQQFVENARELLAIILQVYLALRVAKEKGNSYSHQDLHTKNIILKPLNGTHGIKYHVTNKVKNKIGDVIAVEEKIYVVYTRYVATIIDYGISEIYLPLATNNINSNNAIVETRFGLSFAAGSPILTRGAGNIKDMSTFLGFIAHKITKTGSNTNHATLQQLKVMISDMYIATVKPYLLGTFPTPESKYDMINLDRERFFVLTNDQVDHILRGTIVFEDFLDTARQIINPQIYNEILQDVSGNNYYNNNAPIKYKYPILECDERCLNACATFANIMLSDPDGEASALITEKSSMNNINKNKDIKSINIAYHVLDVTNSLLFFRTSKNPEKPVDKSQYVALLNEKLDETLKIIVSEYTYDEFAQILNRIIYDRIKAITVWIESKQYPAMQFAPSPYAIKSTSLLILDDVTALQQMNYYTGKLEELATIIEGIRDCIRLSNALTILDTRATNMIPMPSKYKNHIISLIDVFSRYYKKYYFPLKSFLAQRAQKNYYSKYNGEFQVKVVNQIPDTITFFPLL